jgi:hypothetical protein
MEQFYKTMKPLFNVYSILGNAPYTLAAEGILTVSVPAVVYRIIFNVLIVQLPLVALIHTGKLDDFYTTPVTVKGKNIRGIATLFPSVLSAGISLFCFREMINIFKHVLYLCTLIEDLFCISQAFRCH